MKKPDSSQVICPYCHRPAFLITARKLYNLRAGQGEDQYYWRCDHCDAHVGCHKKNWRTKHTGTEPLGTLANRALRQARADAHRAFDRLWRRNSRPDRGRTAAYRWLAGQLGIDQNDCHIARFDLATCRKVIEISEMEMNWRDINGDRPE